MSTDSSDAPPSAEISDLAAAGEQLDAVIEAHETTDWIEVPGVTVAEAAAWVSRLVEARDELEAQR